jgi:hypothetical protein
MGVDDVEVIATVHSAQLRSAPREGRRAAWELVQGHGYIVDLAQRAHLVAHEGATLGMFVTGEHVGDHEGA